MIARVLTAAFTLLGPGGAGAGVELGDQVAGGDQVWFFQADHDAEPMVVLCVSDQQSDPGVYAVVRRMAEPHRIAANGRTLWMHVEGDRPGIATLNVLRAHWEPYLDTWLVEPPQGMDLLEPLEIEGPVTGLCGSSTGPILVSKGTGDTLRVDAYRRGAWTTVDRLSPDPQEFLVDVTAHGEGIHLLLDGGPEGARIWSWHQDGPAFTAIDCSEPWSLVTVGQETIVACGGDSGEISLGYLQEGTVAVLAQTDLDQAEHWALAGGSTVPSLIAPGGTEPRIRVVRPGVGTIGPATTLERASNLGTQVWSIFISVGIGVALILVLILSRTLAPVRMPSGWIVAGLSRRLWALLIDLLPGVASAVSVPGAGSSELLRSALTGPTPASLVSLGILSGLTVLWCGAWELGMASTPGKRVMGIVVIDTQGRRPRAWQVVVRNLLKGLVLMAPPLAMLVLIMPLGQGLGDVIARTLVVAPEPGRAAHDGE